MFSRTKFRVTDQKDERGVYSAVACKDCREAKCSFQNRVSGEMNCTIAGISGKQHIIGCGLSISSEQTQRRHVSSGAGGGLGEAVAVAVAVAEEEEECMQTEEFSAGRLCSMKSSVKRSSRARISSEAAAAEDLESGSSPVEFSLRLSPAGEEVLPQQGLSGDMVLSHRSVLPPLPIMMDPMDRAGGDGSWRPNGKINDDRLFPQYPLYCEGMPKPRMRGVIHLLYALLLPLGVAHLWWEANGSAAGRTAGVVFALSNLYCVGMSALYHIGNWSAKTEIFIQKLDHSAISVYATGVNFPSSLLLLPAPCGAALIGLSALSTVWATWHIFHNRPAVWRHAVTSVMIIAFSPMLFWYMTTLEFSCGALNTLIQSVGMIVFVRQRPDPCPRVCGYHEVFHFICILGMTVTYICNWSIMRRTCNPYAVDADIMHAPLFS